MSKRMSFALVLVSLIAGASVLQAKEKPTIAAGPDVRKGDPPPGNAMSLSGPQARAALRETIKAIWAGTLKRCQIGLCDIVTISDVKDVSIRSSGIAFTQPYTYDLGHKGNSDGKKVWDFKGEKTNYAQEFDYRFEGRGQQLYSVLFDPRDMRGLLVPGMIWSNKADAQKFADAFNRLLYAAYHPGDEDNEFAAFTAAAKAWRENPVKPPLSAETERQRILAENAIQEKNLDAAIEHYESGVEAQPTWPAGWYNLALIYAEQKNYSDAADRMKHYLELVPDAPDAKDARTQMIIWEDKAGKQQ